MPDSSPEGDRRHRVDRPLHRETRRQRTTRYRYAEETSTSASARDREATDSLSQGSDPTRWRSRSRTRSKEDPRDFALWKANTSPARTQPHGDSPWGRGGPPRLAHRVLGDGRERVRAGLRDSRRRPRPQVFPHHENELAQSLSARPRVRPHLDAQRDDLRHGRREDVESRLGNLVSLRNVVDTWGREVVLLFFLGAHWRKPLDYSEETLKRAQRRAERMANAYLAFPWRALRRHLETGANSDELRQMPEIQRYLVEMLIAGSDLKWHPNDRWGPDGQPRSFAIGDWSSTALEVALNASGAGTTYDVHAEETARFEWGRFVHALDHDFNLPEALAALPRDGASREDSGVACAGASACSGLASLARRGRAFGFRLRRLSRSRRQREDRSSLRGAEDFPGADAAARRDRGHVWLGGARRCAIHPGLPGYRRSSERS